MRQLSASVLLTGALACTAPCLAGEASFITLNTVGASDVTVDEFGRTLVLTTDGSFGIGGVFIYDADGNSYNYIGDGFGSSLSESGTEAAGNIVNIDGHLVAAHWTEGGGWQEIGSLGATGGGSCQSSGSFDISADGSIVVGLGWEGVCTARPFKWTEETGMVGMELLANANSRASVISADGTTAAGFAQGTFNRTPAMWNVADGAGTLFDIDSQGEISAINADGNIVAGRYYDESFADLANGYLLPFYRVGDGPIQIIDSLPGFPGGHMSGMSADGGTIVGTSGIPIEGTTAMVWRPEWGSVSLRDKLIELGVQGLDGVELIELLDATACSADGTKVVGTAIVFPPPGQQIQVRAFVATLPPQIDPVCAEDFDGDGQIGFTDLTQLLGTWGPCAACPEDLDGDDAVGFTDLTQLLGNWGPCI